ncbi:hypothetical protein EXS56_00150 [Candidatus Kaiserbacteria bacterium]|nr:hypothetical protein [Candidatus Kaiserbacteria bacterium]
MNRIEISATVIGLSLLLASTSVVLAKENGEQEKLDSEHRTVSMPLRAQENMQRASDSERATSSNRGEDDSVLAGEEDDMNDEEDRDEGEKHRSEVANVVHSLKELADNDEGIGEEVRKVAQEQASSSEHAAEAMARIKERSAFLTFLFGAGFENLGALRSELSTTQAHIDQLTQAKEKAASLGVKAGIDAQISALQKANADASAFVAAHEDVFSIFGWFAKLFTK